MCGARKHKEGLTESVDTQKPLNGELKSVLAVSRETVTSVDSKREAELRERLSEREARS